MAENRTQILRIKALRVERQMSQGDLAARLGVAQNALCMWETETSLPRTRDLPRLAHVLGCSIDELFTDEAKDLEEAVG